MRSHDRRPILRNQIGDLSVHRSFPVERHDQTAADNGWVSLKGRVGDAGHKVPINGESEPDQSGPDLKIGKVRDEEFRDAVGLDNAHPFKRLGLASHHSPSLFSFLTRLRSAHSPKASVVKLSQVAARWPSKVRHPKNRRPEIRHSSSVNPAAEGVVGLFLTFSLAWLIVCATALVVIIAGIGDFIFGNSRRAGSRPPVRRDDGPAVNPGAPAAGPDLSRGVA